MVDWLNPSYDERVLKRASQRFAVSGNLQLLSFLSPVGFIKLSLEFKHFYVPKKYSYSKAKPPVFDGFQDVMSAIVGYKVKIHSLACCAFQNGDYTLLYDALKPGKGIAFFLDLTDWDISWGGYTSFLKKNKEVMRVIPRKNSLSLVDQNGLKSFTKYVNHHTSRPRLFLYGILLPK